MSEAELEDVWCSELSDPADDGPARQRILSHCSGCVECSDLLKSYLAVEREVQSLMLFGNSQVNKHCPDEDLWLKFAADVLSKKTTKNYRKHLDECQRCSQRLKTIRKYTAEDVEGIEDWENATPAWQRMIAQQMVLAAMSSPLSARRPRFPRGRLLWLGGVAAATLALVFASAAWLLRATRPGAVERLLGQAYSQNRTLEPRIFGATYGRLQLERSGSVSSRIDKPPALLKAEELISRHLRENSGDPVWLDLKGRADLLDGNYEAALKSFQEALQAQPDSVVVLIDTAIAYIELGELADRGQDYGKAIELLSKALSKKQDDPIALYNRALANEKMFLYHQAIEDWQHYLRIDPKGQWAAEANRHLSALNQKLAAHENSISEPLLDPATLITEESGKSRGQLWEDLSRRDEEYLDKAIREWLPKTFTRRRQTKSTPAGIGSLAAANSGVWLLHLLSQVLKTKHNDKWLTDLLLESRYSPVFPEAVAALGHAVSANSTGDYASARKTSVEAIRLFQQATSIAGEVRARYELVYALERSFQQKRQCLMAAIPIGNELRHHHYPWIGVQLGLERSNCWMQAGDFGKAHEDLQAALFDVREAGYATLRLRVLGMAAVLQSREGDAEHAYSADREGLARYWDGVFPGMRAYQFYSDLGVPAEEAEQWNFSLALAKEALSAVMEGRQPLAQAFGHHRLAKIALMVGNKSLAAAEFDKASSLFASLPQTPETAAYEADAEIELARLQSAHGDATGSWNHLLAARNLMPRMTHYSVALSYYQTLWELNLRKGNHDVALQALQSAVAIAENGLLSLRNERERIIWARDTSQIYRDFAFSKWRSQNVDEAFQVWEWYRGAALRVLADVPKSQFGWLEGTLATPKQKGFLASLPKLSGRTVVSYLQLSDGVIVWVLTERGLASKWIGVSRPDMERLAHHFRDECANRNSDLAILRRDARNLYDLLIAPVAELLDNHTLVVELDDTIAEVPIVALVDGSGHYVGETYAVVVSPGLLYEQRTKNPRFSPRQRALVVGAPALKGWSGFTLNPDNAVEEVEYVASKFWHPKVFSGGAATLETVRRELPQANVLHFAGHGLVARGKTGLLLARSEDPHGTITTLDAASLAGVKMPYLDLAVLSGCVTAGEGEGDLRSADNLIRTLLHSRTPHVVASQWNVDSATTAELMHVFYDRLMSGSSVPLSVQSASAAVRREAATRHPYYWAAFVAFGS